MTELNENKNLSFLLLTGIFMILHFYRMSIFLRVLRILKNDIFYETLNIILFSSNEYILNKITDQGPQLAS